MTAALVLLFATLCQAAEYTAPAGVRPAIRRPGATGILPGGRVLNAIGKQYVTGPGPFAMAISPNGKTIASANRGPERFSITVLERDKSGQRLARHAVAGGDDEWRGVSTGIEFDGEHTLYVSEGATGRVFAMNPGDGARKKGFDLNQDGASDSFSGDMAMDAERKLLWVVDRKNARLVAIDVGKRRIAASLEIGGQPGALALAPDRRRAYVLIGGEKASLAVVNLDNAAKPSVAATVALPGRPTALLATGERVYVSDGADDAVIAIDARTNAVAGVAALRIAGLENLRGLTPYGLAFHAASGWLLVAEAGANAVAVIDTKTMSAIGHIPVGWVPTHVLMDGDTVYVSNSKGQGTGPNTGMRPHDVSFAATLRRGSITTFPLPGAAELAEMTGRMMAANGFTPKGNGGTAIPEGIRHVALIVKGNRTFDDILGDVRQASNGDVMSSAALARFGRSGYADGRNQRLSLQRIDMTPNHHALAGTFAFSDNFYADGGIPFGWLERKGISFGGEKDATDQARASRVIGEIGEKYGEGKQELPGLIVIRLPNSRLGEPRPGDGFPYVASYMGDNDYALGRIVEFLSHSRWWRNMAIFITEEDAAGGLDHIDAQRTILLAAGPYLKKNYVSHVNASYPGLLKTIFRILHFPPLTLLDATASDLGDVFTDTPDETPYKAAPVDPRLFDPAKITEQRR